jgi:hypothetical protein
VARILEEMAESSGAQNKKLEEALALLAEKRRPEEQQNRKSD